MRPRDSRILWGVAGAAGLGLLGLGFTDYVRDTRRQAMLVVRDDSRAPLETTEFLSNRPDPSGEASRRDELLAELQQRQPSGPATQANQSGTQPDRFGDIISSPPPRSSRQIGGQPGAMRISADADDRGAASAASTPRFDTRPPSSLPGEARLRALGLGGGSDGAAAAEDAPQTSRSMADMMADDGMGRADRDDLLAIDRDPLPMQRQIAPSPAQESENTSSGLTPREMFARLAEEGELPPIASSGAASTRQSSDNAATPGAPLNLRSGTQSASAETPARPAQSAREGSSLRTATAATGRAAAVSSSGVAPTSSPAAPERYALAGALSAPRAQAPMRASQRVQRLRVQSACVRADGTAYRGPGSLYDVNGPHVCLTQKTASAYDGNLLTVSEYWEPSFLRQRFSQLRGLSQSSLRLQ